MKFSCPKLNAKIQKIFEGNMANKGQYQAKPETLNLKLLMDEMTVLPVPIPVQI